MSTGFAGKSSMFQFYKFLITLAGKNERIETLLDTALQHTQAAVPSSSTTTAVNVQPISLLKFQEEDCHLH